MPVSRDEVALCYRQLLGREPENDFVVREKVRGHANLRQLIETFVASAEYRLKLESDGRALRIDEVEVRHTELTQALADQRAEHRRRDDLKSDVRQKLAILRNQDYAIIKRIVLDHAPRHWRAYALALAATTFVFDRSFSIYGLGLVAFASSDNAVKSQIFAALKDIFDNDKAPERDIRVAAINAVALVRPESGH